MEPADNLTANQSLELITRMIHQAKGRVQQNSFYFLLWGWVVLLGNLGAFILGRMGVEHPYAIWLITIPAWIVTIVYGIRKRRESSASSPFARISMALWMSFGVVIFTVVVFGSKINFQLYPIILLLSAIPTFTSGTILKFNPLIIGGVLFWLSGIVSFLLPMDIQPLLGAAAIAACYLVPGYMLKSQKGDV